MLTEKDSQIIRAVADVMQEGAKIGRALGGRQGGQTGAAVAGVLALCAIGSKDQPLPPLPPFSGRPLRLTWKPQG